MEKEVVIFSTPTCHFCQQTKEFLKEHNIDFTEHDVSVDQEKRQEMIEKSGQMGVPVLFIGEEIIIGYDEPKIKQELGL